MSVSFPLTYKSENNSKMRKYYQLENASPSINLETDICLKNLLKQLDDTTIDNQDKNYLPTNVVFENTNYATHLSLEDPNCSITNPTTFCISANFLEQEVSANPNAEQSYTVTIGTNNFNNIVNNITTTIQLATDNSPIFDTNLLINVVNNNDLCYSVDNTVTASFDGDSPYILLSKAINSKLYNKSGQSLLTFGEDIDFNNNYALGNTNALNKYYTQVSTTNELVPNNIALSYLQTTNNILVKTIETQMDTNPFGSYRINIIEAYIDLSNNNVDFLSDNTFFIGNANDDININVSTLIDPDNNLNYYNTIFNDTSPNNSFQIKVATIDPNSGLNFTNPIDINLFTIDNSTMIENIQFMKNIIVPNVPISVNLTQTPMTITHNPASTSTAYVENNESFELTSNGETLGNTEYNTNGEIKLVIEAIDNRVTKSSETLYETFDEILDKTVTVEVFTAINVDYESINFTNELRDKLNIRYEIKNIIVPTPDQYNQYGAISVNNYTALYMSNSDTINSEISVANINSSDDEILLIKINPLNVLTNDLNGNKIYALDNYDPLVSQPINANIYVDITGDISILKEKYDLRFKITPKKITDLSFASSGTGGVGYNSLVVYDNDSLNNYGGQSPNSWVLGYKQPVSGNQYFITTDVTTFSDSNYFPSFNECTDICNNNRVRNIQFSYSTESTPLIYYDVINIFYNNEANPKYAIPQTNITKSQLSDVNTYENQGSIVLGNNNVSYKIVKNTRVTSYYTTFSFNLAGTTNLAGRTPLLKSTYTTYYIYANTVTITIAANNSSYTAYQGSTSTPANTINLLLLTETETNTYKTSYVVRLNNDISISPELNFNITRSGVTSLNGSIQYRNQNEDDSYTVWADIGSPVLNLEPYLGTNAVSVVADLTDTDNTNNYSISASIVIDKTNNILVINKPEYFTPLFIEYGSTTAQITGYKYDIDKLAEYNFVDNFDPKYFINNSNNLPVSNMPLDLSVNVTYYIENQNFADYNSRFTITDNSISIPVIVFELTRVTFINPIIIAQIKTNIFKVSKYVESNEPTTIKFLSDNNNDMIDISDGITIEYKNNNMRQANYVNFALNADKIGVQLVTTGLPIVPEFISSLTYGREGCETLSIPFYRGYITDNQEIEQTYNYIINRNNLVSCTINAGNTFTANFAERIYKNYQNTVNFGNGIGSIGVKITPSFSRLPASLLTNNTRTMPISVSSDSIEIRRNETSSVVSLKDYILYTFPNGQVLKSVKLRLNNVINEDFYKFSYTKSDTNVYYNNNYIGNPENIIDSEWTKIVTMSYDESIIGFKVDSSNLNSNGFLSIQLNQNSKTNSNTYIVIASPQLVATQMGIDGVKNFLIDETNTDVYDASKLITQYFPIVQNELSSNYYPFVNKINVNNIRFNAPSNKSLADYKDYNKNVSPVHFNINGSSVTITEVIRKENEGNIPTSNGPNGDGIIFNGLISDLISLPINNPYYSSIKLESKSTENGELKLSYTQDSSNYFEIIFNESDVVKPENNMKFIIGNSFIETGEYELNSSSTKGVKINIYDMVKRESDIVLLKYEQSNIDFTNIPNNTLIKQIIFAPNQVYKSVVTMPPHVFGTKYNDTFNAITSANMNLDASGNIIWTPFVSTILINNFSLQIKAIDATGLNHIIEMLYATSEIPVNFTVFKQSNTMEIFAADGTPRFIISPFGQIQTPSVNTKDLTIYDLSLNNNVEILKANVSILNELN